MLENLINGPVRQFDLSPSPVRRPPVVVLKGYISINCNDGMTRERHHRRISTYTNAQDVTVADRRTLSTDRFNIPTLAPCTVSSSFMIARLRDHVPLLQLHIKINYVLL